MRIQMLERHRKIHTGERPYRWTLCLSTNILNWFIFQVRQMWWGIYSKWGFKATYPKTQNQWGHPYGGGKTADRGTEKALWIVWSKVPRSRRPEKTSQISCGHQRLCLRILRESVWIKEGDGLAHQRCASWGKELPLQGMRKTVWSTHNFESSHAESYRRASISGLLHNTFVYSHAISLQCDYCNAGFKEKRNLQNHIAKSHPNSYMFKEENSFSEKDERMQQYEDSTSSQEFSYSTPLLLGLNQTWLVC